MPNVVTDKVDITCQFMTVTAARAQLVNFTIPYYREGVGLLLTKDGKYKSFDEMKAGRQRRTVSVLQNVYAEDMVHQALPEAKVDQYDSVDLMYQALNSGRADAAATDCPRRNGSCCRTPTNISTAAMAGTRRPMPAPSSAARPTG